MNTRNAILGVENLTIVAITHPLISCDSTRHFTSRGAKSMDSYHAITSDFVDIFL